MLLTTWRNAVIAEGWRGGRQIHEIAQDARTSPLDVILTVEQLGLPARAPRAREAPETK